jgi:hypothetical protein
MWLVLRKDLHLKAYRYFETPYIIIGSGIEP